MDELHMAAFRARLEDAAPLKGKVFDTARLDADGGLVRATYAIVFGGGPDVLDDERMTAPQRLDSKAEYVFTVRGVATNPGGVRALLRHVRNQLVGHRLQVGGRACDPIRLTSSEPVDTDNNVRPALHFADDEFTFVSRPFLLEVS